MAITVNSTPDSICLAGNRQFLDLTSDKRILSAGSPAAVELDFGSDGVDGDGWIMSYDTEELTFTIKDVPDDSGFELPTFNDVSSFDDFVDELRLNFYIDRDFTVTKNTANPLELKCTLTHKLNGEAYNLFLTGQVGVSVTYTDGVDDDVADSFEPYMRMYCNLPSGWQKVSEHQVGADLNGNFKFFLDQILRAYFIPPHPNPDHSGAGIGDLARRIDDYLLEYYVVYNEYYGNPPQHYKPQFFGDQNTPKQAANISLERQEVPSVNGYFRFFGSASDRHMLTEYSTKTLHKSQIQYFYWYFPEQNIGDNVQLEVDEYYTDGTSAAGNLPVAYQLVAAQDAGVYEMVLDMSRLPSNLFKIDVFAKATGPTPDETSKKLTLYVDNFDYRHIHYFLYLNRFGVYQTIYFTGELMSSINVSSQESVRTEFDSYDQEDPEVTLHAQNSQEEFTIGTGLKRQKEFESLDEFLSSSKVFILDGQFNTAEAYWRPVIVDPKSIKNFGVKDGGGFVSGQFKFKNAFLER